MKKLSLFFMFCAYIMILGCSLYQKNLIIKLEELPLSEYEQEYQNVIEYKLVYFDDGRNEFLLNSRDSLLTITLPSEKYIPFLVYPISNGIPLKPAGAIFPYHYDETRALMVFDWKQGPLAEMVMKLAEKGFFLESFNLAKLEHYLTLKFSENPWDWDQQNFMNALVNHEADYFDIRKRGKHEFLVDLPVDLYFSEYPDVESFSNTSGKLSLWLYEGYNRFFNRDFSIVYHIQVSSRECLIQREWLNEDENY
ncbi:MAG: hypothetical protein JXR70_06530 [Spirochaetales bacterium]|nr:hypothetical protein [Spirochaetales bacterium]